MEVLNFNHWLEGQIKNVTDMAGLNGVPMDQVKLLFCLFAAYPLSSILSSFPKDSTNAKHIFNVTIGFWFGWFTLGPLILHTTVCSAITYLLLVSFDVRKGFVHKLVFVFVMAYLSLSHVYRMYYDYLGWSIDFTGPQMLLTLKLTTLAFDYYDGTIPSEKLTSYQKQMAFQKFPSFIEYWSYIYFFPGFLAGPVFNFKEFRQYINMEMFKSASKGQIPAGKFQALKKFLFALILLFFVLVGFDYKMDYMKTKEFFEESFFFRLWYIWFSTSLARFPYYFAWTLAEGACILAGIAYSGIDTEGNNKWDRAINVKVLDFELAQNLRGCTESWNIRTDKWLKHYIYERVPKFNVALTFLCSSIWHGFYPGYYLSFMSASFMIQAMRIIRRNIQARFVNEDGTAKSTKIFYDILTIFGTSSLIGYLFAPFKLLDGRSSWKVWSSVYFIGHLATFFVVLLALVLGSPRRSRKDTATKAEKAKGH